MADGGTGGGMSETGFDAAKADPRLLRDAFGRFATGVTVVTIAGPEGPMGFTANSFSSLSLDPPLVLWAPAKSSSRFAAFATARHFAIHILADDQIDLCRRFARSAGSFDGLAHDTTPEGLPVLPQALARFECVQHATHEGGDHLIVVGRVLRAAFRDGRPLIFATGNYGAFAEAR